MNDYKIRNKWQRFKFLCKVFLNYFNSNNSHNLVTITFFCFSFKEIWCNPATTNNNNPNDNNNNNNNSNIEHRFLVFFYSCFLKSSFCFYGWYIIKLFLRQVIATSLGCHDLASSRKKKSSGYPIPTVKLQVIIISI